MNTGARAYRAGDGGAPHGATPVPVVAQGRTRGQGSVTKNVGLAATCVARMRYITHGSYVPGIRLSADVVWASTGYGVAYIDWSQQEFGIAAALSGDLAMQQAYQSGDPYLAFAKQVGAAPALSLIHI